MANTTNPDNPTNNPNLVTIAGEHCECSRCGTIYPTEHYPKNCPGCGKRRTHKDRLFNGITYTRLT